MKTKKMKVFLHAGLHKTGSTAIQSYLKLNNDELKYNNIYYDNELSGRSQVDINFCIDMDRNIREAYSLGAVNYIISNERLLGTPRNGYNTAKDNATLIVNTLQSIDFVEFELIIFVRRQDDFFKSSYIQQIKQGESLSFDEYFNKKVIDSFDWLELYRILHIIFDGRINFLEYSNKFEYNPHHIYNEADRVFELPSELTRENKNFNPSYGDLALNIALQFNQKFNGKEKNRNKWLREILQRELNNVNTSKVHIIDNSRLLEITKRYKASNMELAKMLGFSDTFYCFDDLDKLPEIYNDQIIMNAAILNELLNSKQEIAQLKKSIKNMDLELKALKSVCNNKNKPKEKLIKKIKSLFLKTKR
ncbi:hypothetical protein [Photobacterium proteolyticum]|nr:hypothetical protein [Photobacterium proteolyticum]